MDAERLESDALVCPPRYSAIFRAALLVFLVTGSSSASGETTSIDGVPHVRNEATPAGGRVTLMPHELWRIGGPDDELLFGNIGRVDRSAAGDFYILDRQLCEVTVLTKAGEFVRTLGREGEGPGELYRPADFFLRSDGGVGLLQQFPGKVVLIDGEGTPAGTFTLSSSAGPGTNFMALVDSRSRGDQVVIAGIEMAFDAGKTKQTYFLSAVDMEGVRHTNYQSKENTIDFANFEASEEIMDFVWWGQRWAMTAAGEVLANPQRNQYRIEQYGSDGNLIRIVEREYESWQRSDEERADAERVLRAAVSGYPAPPTSLEVEPTDPDISAIYPRANGAFWVRTSRGDRPGSDETFTIFDVYDADGNFTQQIELRMPGNIGHDALYVCGDRLVRVTHALDAFVSGQPGAEDGADAEATEPEELEVVCYALGEI